MNSLLNFLSWSVTGISVIIAVLLFYRRKEINGFLFYFAIWVVFGAFFEIISTFLGSLGVRNLFLFHLNALIEFTVLTLYFDRIFQEIDRPGIKKVLWPGLFLIVCNTLFIQDLTLFNSYSLTAISLAMVFFSLIYFIRLFETEMVLEKKMFRGILTGSIFMIHCTHLIPMLFGNTLLGLDPNQQKIIWIVRASIIFVVKIIIFYTLIGHFMHAKDQKYLV